MDRYLYLSDINPTARLLAQHRVRLTYAQMRGGGFQPTIRTFQVGDFVYIKQKALTTLQFSTKSAVLRVREVCASGVLTPQGCGG